MNSFESAFWMLCLLALHPDPARRLAKLWLLFGAAAGLGLLNKPSMTFFLVALLLALLLTPQRRLLASRWAAAGVALLLLIALPNLLWQIHNHWPTLEFLRNDAAGNKSIQLAPLAFLLTQILTLSPHHRPPLGSRPGPPAARAKTRRWLGLTYLSSSPS